MRYALRRQERLKEAFGDAFLSELNVSLQLYFGAHTADEIQQQQHPAEPYPTINVPCFAESSIVYVLYCTQTMYDVQHLAFKETIKK